MPALPLTPEQKEDAARLKSLFREWQAEQKEKGDAYSQDSFSDLLGFGQSALSQYLNGKIPLNPTVAAKFSRVLKRPICDFSKAIAEQASEIALATNLTPQESVSNPGKLDITELSKPEIQLILMFRELGQSQQSEVLRLTQVFHRSSKEDKRISTSAPSSVRTKRSPANAK